LDLELSQLGDFLAWLQPSTPEEPGNFRSQPPGSSAFALRGVAQDFTHFFLDASPVPLRSPLQLVLYFVLELPNNKLRHIYDDIMISMLKEKSLKSDTKDWKWRVADHGVGQIPQAAVRAMRTSSDHQQISIESARSFKQSVLDGADDDLYGRSGPNFSLQIGNALTRFLPFFRLNFFLKVQTNGQTGIGGLNGMNNVEVTARFRRCLMSKTENSF
jgi:hypothetical protein